ncbi:MAG: zinc dependent phospholipase C family protein [Anaerostipes sp.]|jgi:hypothetical protein|nr:zinc dependent phospholipase C family protein [Anaerostipes sp.]MDD3745456.1 zinc dependent phospholipase C family protein [Anaerostipes sp.]
MRKKSHISLAGQIMDSLDLNQVFDYKMPFYVGSIWPDCRPSFITTPHTYDVTYHKIKGKLEEFVEEYNGSDTMNMRSCAKLGVMIHYIADYFTFPHNSHYVGNVKDHCIYERDLKHELKSYLSTEEARSTKDQLKTYSTVDELKEFIQRIHKQYISKIRCVEEDIQYIVKVCTTVVLSVVHMITVGFESVHLKLKYV